MTENKSRFKLVNVDSDGTPTYQLPEVTVVSKIPEELRRQLIEPIYSRNSYKYNVDGVAEVNRIFDRKPLYKLTKKNKPVYQSRFDYSNPLYSEWEKQEDNNMRALWEHGYVDLVKALQNTLYTQGQYAYKDALELALAKIQTINRDNKVLNEVIRAQHEGKSKFAKSAFTAFTMLPGVDTLADIGYTALDAIKGNWKDAAIGLGFIAAPGLGYGAYKGLKHVKRISRNKSAARLIKKELNKGIKRQDDLIRQYGFHPGHTVPTGQFTGLPDPDPNTFYHAGNFTNLDVAPKSGGYVKIQDGNIVPMQSYHPGGEDRIWWSRGEYYKPGSSIMLSTKSGNVNENVAKNLNKYSSSHEYNPRYYTSGSIPIEEVTIYRRNPFTGYYDSSIPYKSPESVIHVNSSKLVDNSRFGKAHNKSFMHDNVDEVALIQQRWENGGWDKLGIDKDMQIKYQGKQVNAREFLRNPQFIPMPSASYLPDSRFMTFDSKAPIRKQSMEKAHELFHAADHIYLETLGDAAKHGDDFQSMGFPGVDYSSFDSPDKLYYFTRMGGTEMKSRFSQLKNYFGIKDANTPLTLKQWEFAKKYYPFNNHMTDFFKSVTNPKDFLNSMNKLVPVGVGISFGINQFNNKTEDNKTYNNY